LRHVSGTKFAGSYASNRARGFPDRSISGQRLLMEVRLLPGII